ncbi:MAG: hypothetical protein CMJ18_12725 [Phycisphaeraceae bacterium]|nr:hypothetical protein [Phycisphaeraceae bacterium]
MRIEHHWLRRRPPLTAPWKGGEPSGKPPLSKGGLGGGLACALMPAVAFAAPKVNFRDHVRPIFDNHCATCHNADKNKAGLDLTSFQSTMTGSSGGEVVVPGNIDDSILYLVVTHLEEPRMPPKQDKLPEAQLETIRKWILGGLLEHSGAEAKKAKKSGFDMALTEAPTGKPEGPPPMPEHLGLEPVVTAPRPAGLAALATSPWAPLAALAGQKQVLLYDSARCELVGVLPFPEGGIEAISFSRNGSLVLAGGGRGGASGRVVVWRVRDGRRVIEVGDERDTVLAADISADQTQVALGGPGRLVKVFDTSDGEMLHAIKKHTNWVTALAYSPDGVLLASGDRNGGLVVWESYSGGEFHTLGGHGGTVTALGWRSDSNVLASAGEDGTIRLWEMFNGKQVKKWNAHDGGVLSMHYGQDGRIVSAGRDRRIKLWNAEGKLQREWTEFNDLALQAALSHDGSHVIGGDWHGQVIAWNAADGKRVGDLSANPPTLATRLDAARKQAAETEALHGRMIAALKQAETEAVEPRARLAEARKTVDAMKQAAAEAEKQMNAARAAHAAAAKADDEASKRRDDMKSKLEAVKATLEKQIKAHEQTVATHATAQQRTASGEKMRAGLRQAADAVRAESNLHPDDAALAELATKAEQTAASADETLAAAKATEKSRADDMTKAKTDADATRSGMAKLGPEVAGAVTAADEAAKQHEAMKAAMDGAEQQHAAAQTRADEAAKGMDARAGEAKPFEEKIAAAAKQRDEGAARLAAAQKQTKKWEAARINIDLIAARQTLEQRQADQSVVAEVVAKAQFDRDSAAAALEAAKKRMAEAPGIVEDRKTTLAAAREAVTKAVEAHEAANRTMQQRQAYVEQLRQALAPMAERAAKETGNEALTKAAAQASATIELLGKDLDATRKQVDEKKSTIEQSKKMTAAEEEEVRKAESDMAAMPKQVEQREADMAKMAAALAKEKTRLEEANGVVGSAQSKVDELDAKYRATLPK